MLNFILQYMCVNTFFCASSCSNIWYVLLSIISFLFEVVKIDYMFSIQLHNRVLNAFRSTCFLLIGVQVHFFVSHHYRLHL